MLKQTDVRIFILPVPCPVDMAGTMPGLIGLRSGQFVFNKSSLVRYVFRFLRFVSSLQAEIAEENASNKNESHDQDSDVDEFDGDKSNKLVFLEARQLYFCSLEICISGAWKLYFFKQEIVFPLAGNFASLQVPRCMGERKPYFTAVLKMDFSTPYSWHFNTCSQFCWSGRFEDCEQLVSDELQSNER